jgi:hypothetical protein
MDPLDDSVVIARRELVLVAVVLVAMSRAAARPEAFLVAGLLPVVTFLAGAALLGGDRVPSRPYGALLIPAVLAGGAAAAIGLVPAGLGLVPALAVIGLLLDRTLDLELRLAAQPTGFTAGDRGRIATATVITAFVAFTGVAALVPGGWAEPVAGAVGADPSRPVLTEGWLLVLALDDALIAFILGYRLGVLRFATRGEALRSALTYAIVIAVAAGALRAIDAPRLVGPAVLALILYLWDTLHNAEPARRRDARFVWDAVLLAALAIAVIAWNLRLRG